ncbi:MAG TPA: hypothetical protein PLB62_14150, partial [Candidatus Sumerlaeota bacterium]|nr:hypothetical protein [Candidatus Sumerlaeota bacterium]
MKREIPFRCLSILLLLCIGLSSFSLAAQPWLVRDINTREGGSSPASFAEMNGAVFFTAKNVEHGRELWKTDGSGPGTKLIKDILPGNAGSSPYQIVNANGILYIFINNKG